jgi:hypothetical protein
MYPLNLENADGKPLDGTDRYSVHFRNSLNPWRSTAEHPS